MNLKEILILRKPSRYQGRNFNQKKFNKIFDDNRIVQPSDEGYGKWMSENEYETDKIKQVINKNQYSQQSFNDIFVNQKKPRLYKNISNLKLFTLIMVTVVQY